MDMVWRLEEGHDVRKEAELALGLCLECSVHAPCFGCVFAECSGGVRGEEIPPSVLRQTRLVAGMVQ